MRKYCVQARSRESNWPSGVMEPAIGLKKVTCRWRGSFTVQSAHNSPLIVIVAHITSSPISCYFLGALYARTSTYRYLCCRQTTAIGTGIQFSLTLRRLIRYSPDLANSLRAQSTSELAPTREFPCSFRCAISNECAQTMA